jgi:hypothetical protein
VTRRDEEDDKRLDPDGGGVVADAPSGMGDIGDKIAPGEAMLPGKPAEAADPGVRDAAGEDS